jgi:hypothetical protein
MKIVAQFVLFLFLSFIALPTIVMVINKDSDISNAYSLTEEENHSHIKVVKAHIIVFEYFDETLSINNINTIFIDRNTSTKNLYSQDIFLPPPEVC